MYNRAIHPSVYFYVFTTDNYSHDRIKEECTVVRVITANPKRNNQIVHRFFGIRSKNCAPAHEQKNECVLTV